MSSPITQWTEKVAEALEPVFGCPAFPPKSMDIKELTKLQALARKAFITSATIELAQNLIGEDEKGYYNQQGWHESENAEQSIRNQLRKQLRQSLKELL